MEAIAAAAAAGRVPVPRREQHRGRKPAQMVLGGGRWSNAAESSLVACTVGQRHCWLCVAAERLRLRWELVAHGTATQEP